MFQRYLLTVLAITVHWIDKDWNLHEALLDFKRLHGKHSGWNLAHDIFDTLDQYNIAEKLFCITTDNASNNGKAMKILSKLLKKYKNVDWKWKERHISCLNHVIDIGVQAFLRKIKCLEESSREEEETGKHDNDDDDDDDNDDDDDDEEEEEEEEEDEINEIDDDEMEKIIQSAGEFQAVLLKLRTLAKVLFFIVAYKISRIPFHLMFCMLLNILLRC
jgi:hypothetical protein